MQKYRNKNIAAFSAVELLVAMAITAVLFAAVALAFNASIINYNQNEKIFRAVNGARVALSQITTQVRTAQIVVPAAPANECTLTTAAGQDITYRYNSAGNMLYLITNDNLSDSDYVVCENVTAMTFSRQTFVEDTQTKVKSVQISMTVASGNVQQTLAAAAVVRKNLD